MITGAAKVAGVVGWPVAHSLSPLIHNAWIEALGLNAEYQRFAVPAERFADFIEQWRTSGRLAGVNVTTPHKAEALRLADKADSNATLAESANVLVFDEQNRMHASTTDGRGLIAALELNFPSREFWHDPIVVIGAGAAARSASWAFTGLSDHHRTELRITNRTFERAAEFCGSVISAFFGRCTAWHAGDDSVFEGAGLIINATSVGLVGGRYDVDWSRAPSHAVALDMTYVPRITPFLASARASGHEIVDGLDMLIGQARPSFELFFGVAPPPPEVVDVRALCLRALGEA